MFEKDIMLTKKFQELFNGTTINQNRVDASVKICKETSISFAKWVIDKHKEYPEHILRYDKLFEFYEKEQETKSKGMIPPKQKADELFRKVGMLMDLKHSEILEVLDFLIETKIISDDLKAGELEYWEAVRTEAKKIE
jgi:hypothetical protein